MLISLIIIFLLAGNLYTHKSTLFKSSKGLSVPDVALININEKSPMNLKQEYLGQYWVLHLMSSWCGYCQNEIKLFDNIRSKSKLPMAVVSYKENNFEKFKLLSKGRFDVMLKDDLGLFFIDLGATGVPRTYLVNDKGQIEKYWNDLNNANNLNELLNELKSFS